MSKLYTSYFNYLSKFIFDFYDMDDDGEITKEDVRLILSSLPIKKQKYSFSYKFVLEENCFVEQIMVQEEITKIIKQMFKKESMKFDTFKLYISKINIDPFIFPLLCLYDSVPFTKQTIHYYSSITPLKNNFIQIDDGYQTTNSSLNDKHLITPFPNLYSNFESSDTLLKNDYLRQFISQKDLKNLDYDLGPKKMSIPFSIQLRKSLQDDYNESLKKDDFGDKKLKRNSIVNISDNYLLDNINADDIEIDNNKMVRASYFKNDNRLNFEGLMYKMTKLQKLKIVYVKIFGNDIYYYNKLGDSRHKSKNNLNCLYLKENALVECENKQFYNFQLIFPKKIKSFYIEDEEKYINCIKIIKKIIRWKDINDYDIKEKIGIGKYGLVRRGIHKITKRKVAVKYVDKREMTLQEMYCLYNEIDILKIIHHPNLLQPYDIIDYHDSCYIISEYIQGGDLYQFLEKKDYKLSESKAVNIIQQICVAVYYLNTYGIIHRDIKPEHILLDDYNEEPNCKLIDFGLSCFIFPKEKRNESYGTIGYIPPEVLEGKLYDKSCDIWTIGILSYLLLVRCLPFDDDHSDEEIKNMILNEEVSYPQNLWKKKSKEGLFFVENVLRKDATQRFNIKDILDLPWFNKFTKAKLPGMRIKYKGDNIFWYYTLYDEKQIEYYKDEIKKIKSTI